MNVNLNAIPDPSPDEKIRYWMKEAKEAKYSLHLLREDLKMLVNSYPLSDELANKITSLVGDVKVNLDMTLADQCTHNYEHISSASTWRHFKCTNCGKSAFFDRD